QALLFLSPAPTIEGGSLPCQIEVTHGARSFVDAAQCRLAPPDLLRSASLAPVLEAVTANKALFVRGKPAPFELPRGSGRAYNPVGWGCRLWVADERIADGLSAPRRLHSCRAGHWSCASDRPLHCRLQAA